MDMQSITPAPLLIVEDDPGLRTFFGDLLTEEGYHFAFASSLEEALLLGDERTFALVLADLFVGHVSNDLERARDLLSLIHPTPLALLTRLPLPGTAYPMDLAFVLPMPFDIEECLGLIATTIHTPLNAEQQRQEETVRRYLKPIQITLRHETQSSHRRSGETRDNSPASCPSE